MLSKSVKAKRRHQSVIAAQIKAALVAAIEPGAGTWTDHTGQWLTCQARSQLRGIEQFDAIAKHLCRFSNLRIRGTEAIFWCDSDVNSALTNTLFHVMRDAGLAE